MFRSRPRERGQVSDERDQCGRENMEGRENTEAKEHYRARGRFRMRRNKSTSDLKKNVERQSSRGICDNWRHKRSTSRSMRKKRSVRMRMSESEKMRMRGAVWRQTWGAGGWLTRTGHVAPRERKTLGCELCEGECEGENARRACREGGAKKRDRKAQ